MIPDPEAEPRPPLTLEFAFTLALMAPLIHLLWFILFKRIGLQLDWSGVGMAALVAYGSLFALCAARFRQPPARQLGLGPAPASAWLAVLCLVPSLVVSSEIDNLVKALVPPPPVPAEIVGEPPLYLVPALAVVFVGVFPLVYDFFFRGVLQPLASARLGAVSGVTLTAVLSGFAAAFLPALFSAGMWALVPSLCNALILCVVRQSSKSLWPAFALHSLWGVAAIAAQFEAFGLAGFDVEGAHTPGRWVAAALALTLVGLGLCRAAARSGPDGSSNAAPG